jgi:KGK domain
MSQSNRITLSAKDVVSVENFQGQTALMEHTTLFKVQDLIAQVEASCIGGGSLSADEVQQLISQGLPCEVLCPGAADWQAGSLRLSLEFIPGAMPGAASRVAVGKSRSVPQPPPAKARAAAPSKPVSNELDFLDPMADLGTMINATSQSESTTVPDLNFDLEGNHDTGTVGLDLDAAFGMSTLEETSAASFQQSDSPWDGGDLESLLAASN